jgi:hypothetical protein
LPANMLTPRMPKRKRKKQKSTDTLLSCARKEAPRTQWSGGT